MPFFSIVITTYNHESFIKDSILSALSQKFDDFEVIVSNDRSTDGTRQILNSLRHPRLKVFHQSKNLGRVDNYRKCLYEYVTGRWVVYCDGDDMFIDSYFLKDAFELISSSPNAVVLQAAKLKGKDLESSTLFLHEFDDPIRILGFKDFLKNKKQLTFSHLNTIYNVKRAREIDFYRKDILSSDKESVYRLLPYGKLILINKAYGLWRNHGNNAPLNANYKDRIENLEWANSCFWWFLRKKGGPHNVIRWYFGVKFPNLKAYISDGTIIFLKRSDPTVLAYVIRYSAIQDLMFFLNPYFYLQVLRSIRHKW